MKKILILAALLVALLVACSDKEELVTPPATEPVPEQPNEPEQPEPEAPSEPEEPTDPSEPEPDPEEPGEPSEPEPEPEEPGEPSEPEPDPEEPNEPEPDPEEPGEPSEPDPEEPVEPEPDPEEPNEPEPEPTPTPTGKSIVFARGVTRESGWYDVNKIGSGQTNGDINMCWAASSSNIIEWWQDRYREAGFELPEGAVTGRGEKYELALMEMFHSEWDNSRGGHVNHAVHWYFEGKNICKEASPGSQAQPLREDSGGYYRDVWDEIYPHLYHEYEHLGGLYKGLYAGEFNNYYLWGNGVPYLSGEERLRIFSTYVVDAIRRGVPSLALALSPNLSSLHHATTLWGYEIDNATGLLTRVWITDSDDMTTEPKHPVLHEYSVSVSGYNTIQLSGAPYGACYAVTLLPVSGYDMF